MKSAVLMAGLFFAVAAQAQSPPSGSTPLTPGKTSYVIVKDSSEDIHAAIETTIHSMSFITRPIARSRLARTNPLPQRMRVEVGHDSVGVAFDDGNAVITPTNGNTVPWANSLTHETYQAHMSVSGDTVRQTIAAPDGVRENAYVMSDDGNRLALRVTITSHRLPKPLVYTLIFRKSAA